MTSPLSSTGASPRTGCSRTRTASHRPDFTRAASRLRAARTCRPHTAPHVLRLLPAAAGEENLKRLINWVLAYFAQLDIPVKRGTFVEFRQGARLIPRRCCSRPPPPALRRSSPHTCTHVSATAARDAPRRRALRAQACSERVAHRASGSCRSGPVVGLRGCVACGTCAHVRRQKPRSLALARGERNRTRD